MASCQLTHYAENAALLGIVLEDVQMIVKGQFNPLPGNGYEAIEFETRIQSTEPPSRIVELAKRAEKECYVTNTLKKAATVSGKVFLNGQPLTNASSYPKLCQKCSELEQTHVNFAQNHWGKV